MEELKFSMPNVFSLHNIEKECFGRDAWNVGNLVSEFNNEFSHFFAEERDGKIVGYVCIRIVCEEAQVCNIAVLPEYRRQGIGKKLVETMAQFAREAGCERCELEVNTENIPAAELYKKCGFEVAGVRKNFYRRNRYKSRDAYTMVLELQK